MPDLASLALDQPAALLWSSQQSFGTEFPELRRDFGRLDEALHHLMEHVALGRTGFENWRRGWLAPD